MYKYQELKAETIVPKGAAITLQMYGKGDVDEAISEIVNECNTYEHKMLYHQWRANRFADEHIRAEAKLANAHRALCLLRIEYARQRFNYYDTLDRTWKQEYIEKNCAFWDKVQNYWENKLEEQK